MESVQLPVEVDVKPDTEAAPTQHQHMVDMFVQVMPQKKLPVMITTVQVFLVLVFLYAKRQIPASSNVLGLSLTGFNGIIHNYWLYQYLI